MPRTILPLLSLLLVLAAAAQAKIPDDKIKIGVLQDLPAPYAAESGSGGVVAAQLAAADFEVRAFKDDAEILPGTIHAAPEAIFDQVRDWLDKEHVAAVLSSAGPMVDAEIAKMVTQRHRTLLVAETDDGISGKLCSPDVVVWGAGVAARARAVSMAVAPHGGQWFVLADQSPAGLAGQEALQAAAEATGGKVVDTADNVVGGADLGRVLPTIDAAKPQVVALAESDGDLVKILRNALLVGLPHDTILAGPYARIADIDQAGPAVANGLIVAAPFYWDTDGHTRDFARRWSDRMEGRHVTANAADVYAAALSFLNAVKAADDVDASKVLPVLRHAPIKDTLFGTATVRSDGRVLYDLNVYRVKVPDQVQAPWEYYTKVATIDGVQAFPPTSCGGKPTD